MTVAFSSLSAVCFNLRPISFQTLPPIPGIFKVDWESLNNKGTSLSCCQFSVPGGLDLFFPHWFRLCIFPLHPLSFIFLLPLPTTHTFFLLDYLACVLPFTCPLTAWGMFSRGPCRPLADTYHITLKWKLTSFHGNGKICLVSKPSFNQVSPCTLALFHNPRCPPFSENSSVCKQ